MNTIPHMVARLVEMNGGNAALAAQQLGSSTASLSRYRAGEARPRKPIEDRLRALVEGGGDLVERAQQGGEENRLLQLENAIASTLDALREEFHRSATVSKRQDVLDLAACRT